MELSNLSHSSIMGPVFQAITFSRMLWTSVLSVPVFGRKPRWFQVLGMTTVSVGLFIKASLIIPGIYPDYQKEEYCQDHKDFTDANITTVTSGQDVKIVFQHWLDHNKTIIGYALFALADIFYGMMFIYEEWIGKHWSMPAMKIIGWEGLFGFGITLVLLIPMNFIEIEGGLADRPYNKLEDLMDTFVQLNNSGWIVSMALIYIISVMGYDVFRLIVNNSMSATTAAVLGNVRLIFVWIFFLLPLGSFLCRVQKEFHYTALIGLTVVIMGVWLYQVLLY